ncbi:MAG TPA: fumarylacetoacetate hydrolase family protein [Rhodocyclaceae bacterium]|jgi:fumarylpyruvate hydrolase
MAAYVLDAPAQPALPVRGSTALYPVRRIFCVGRNYAAHAREMGAAGDKPAGGPMYFTKSCHALAQSGETLPYPPGTSNYHYEVELVIALGSPAFRVSPEAAASAIYGYAVGFDMTRRDLQNAAKDKGHPWDLGKDCEGGAVVSEIVPFAELGLLERGDIRLTRNGELKQQGNLADMIWSLPEVIAHLSQYYHLLPGDLIFTGTPEGVGPVVASDTIVGMVDGVGSVTLHLGPAE